MPATTLDHPPVPPGRTDTREALLEVVTGHVMAHGLANTTLRRLAAVADTNERQLRYHFGTRERLLEAVMGKLRAAESHELIPDDETSLRAATERLWAYFRHPAREMEMRIFFHLAGLAAEDPKGHAAFLDGVVSAWADRFAAVAVRAGDEPAVAQRKGRLLLAALRGLLLDRLLTGDSAVEDAATLLLDLMPDIPQGGPQSDGPTKSSGAAAG